MRRIPALEASVSNLAREAETVVQTLNREGVAADLRSYISEEGQDWKKERQEKDEFLADHLFAPDKVDELDEGTLRQMVRRLWAYSNWTNKDYVLEQMLQSGLDTIRSSLKFLLYSDAPLSDRFDRIRKDVKQMGAASISEILCHFEKARYPIWNRRAREGLVRLGVSEENLPSSAQISGAQYERFCELMRRVLDQVQQDEEFFEDLFVLDYLLYYLSAVKAGRPMPEERRENGEDQEDFDHDEIIGRVLELGDGLGFEVDDEVPVAPRARVDAIWRTRIANLGTISYAFEVHRRGSPDSAIVNLLKVLEMDDSIRKVVLVSSESEIERFRSEIDDLRSFRGAVGYLEVPQLLTAIDHLDGLKEVLADLGLLDRVM